MNVENLIMYLNQIEDKKAKVYFSNYDFNNNCEIQDCLEIRTSNNIVSYPKGVVLVGDL